MMNCNPYFEFTLLSEKVVNNLNKNNAIPFEIYDSINYSINYEFYLNNNHQIILSFEFESVYFTEANNTNSRYES